MKGLITTRLDASVPGLEGYRLEIGKQGITPHCP